MGDLLDRILAPVPSQDEEETSIWAECVLLTQTIEKRVTESLKTPTLSGVIVGDQGRGRGRA